MKLASWSLLTVVSCFALSGCNLTPIGSGPGPFFDEGIAPFDGGVPPFLGPQPTFGATTTAATPPPPLSGGTLRILADGKTAVATDPDRDKVYVVDTVAGKLTFTIALNAGDEPGRVVDDAAGRVHLVTRRGGALVTIDPVQGAILYRRSVCPAPRGVTYEAASDRVHVACAGGELVSLPAAGGAALRTVQLDLDLRDVVASGGYLWVTTFRTANILLVDGNGAVAKRFVVPMMTTNFKQTFEPSVAWRLQPLSDGRMALVHQLGLVDAVQVVQGGYGGGGFGGCSTGIVQSAVAIIDARAGVESETALFQAVLPVDLAVEPKTSSLAIAVAGNSHTAGLPQVINLPGFVVPSPPDMGPGTGTPPAGCFSGVGIGLVGEITSLAFDGKGQIWAQTREPAQLLLVTGAQTSQPGGVTISLSSTSRADTGWAVFHSNSGAMVACASCHPEGHEDGRVWEFNGVGPRRTQSLRGHVGGTEPFHWNGDLGDFDALFGEVYRVRMSGPDLPTDKRSALFAWINSIPTVPHSPPADPAAVMRGQALFEDTKNVGCSTCHAGPELTNNATVDVGTGGSFQVPRLLGVGWRAPFLHDGCAPSLADRFGACGGGDQHGLTSQLTPAQKADLIAYLSTL
jgi:hypothetical protein